MSISGALAVIIEPQVWLDSADTTEFPELTATTIYNARKYDLTKWVTAYTHSHDAVGGCDKASIDVVVDGTGHGGVSDYLLSSGVGANITVYSGNGLPVWAGFINSITMSRGGVSITRGPYTDIANRVRVRYTTKRWDTTPPVGGQEKVTDWAGDLASQAVYGIISAELSGGEGEEAEMIALRDKHLAEVAYPQNETSVNIGGSDIAVSIECLGYIHRLKMMQYTSTATANADRSDVVADVIDASLMPWLKQSFIEVNTAQSGYQYTDRDGMTRDILLKRLVALSDASGNRYTYGFEPDGRFVYAQIPNYFDYEMSQTSGVDSVRRFGGSSAVDFEFVQAGRWLFVPDMLTAASVPFGIEQMRRDPRAIFIERVDFTAPASLSITGLKIEGLRERLDSFGLGVSAR